MIFPKAGSFEWDEGNKNKNISKHNVLPIECEEIFFNAPWVDEIPETEEKYGEKRFFLLGVTDKGRKLTLIFTTRKEKIRVISARDMSKKERREYEKENKKGSSL